MFGLSSLMALAGVQLKMQGPCRSSKPPGITSH